MSGLRVWGVAAVGVLCLPPCQLLLLGGNIPNPVRDPKESEKLRTVKGSKQRILMHLDGIRV